MAKLIKKLVAFLKLPQKKESLNAKIKKDIQRMLERTGPDEFLKGSKWKWSSITGDCCCIDFSEKSFKKNLLPILKKYELVIGDDAPWLYIEYRANEEKVIYVLDLGYDSFPITNVMSNPKLDAKVKELAFAAEKPSVKLKPYFRRWIKDIPDGVEKLPFD